MDWSIKQQVLAAIAEDGEALRYASKELKGVKEVIMAAVAKNGRALYHASKE